MAFISKVVKLGVVCRPIVVRRLFSSKGPAGTIKSKTDEDFDCNYAAFFDKPDIDGWEIRKAMNDIHGMDLIPDPIIMNAALRACRRVNDYALAIRFLEAVRVKTGNHLNKIWPYILQEINPTLEELGIETPEQLGFDKPELHLYSVYDPDLPTKEAKDKEDSFPF